LNSAWCETNKDVLFSPQTHVELENKSEKVICCQEREGKVFSYIALETQVVIPFPPSWIKFGHIDQNSYQNHKTLQPLAHF
jgi:hypothetical protein